jgi:cytochrome c556
MSLSRLARLAAPLLLATTVLASTATADTTPPSKGEQALTYRKAVYQVIVWNFGRMSAVAQGKAPYDALEFSRRADRVAALTPLLTEAYPPESQGVANSKLKPEMWSNRADFDSKLKDLIDRSAALASVAKGGDFEKSKAAFFDTANACKACHEKYRAE